MKYLQYGKGDVFINNIPRNGLEPAVARFVGQPTYGKTTILIENEDRSKSKIYRMGKKLNPLNPPVKYTWRFEYYNNKPAIILNFSKIDLSNVNGDCIVCLEYRNMNRHSSSGKTDRSFFNGIGPKFNNHVHSGCLPDSELNITNAYYLKDLQCNKDYVLYIQTFNRYNENYTSPKYNHQKPSDWECRLWVRPTIRGNFKSTLKQLQAFNLKRLYTHCSKVPAESYKLCKFPYKDLD